MANKDKKKPATANQGNKDISNKAVKLSIDRMVRNTITKGK